MAGSNLCNLIPMRGKHDLDGLIPSCLHRDTKPGTPTRDRNQVSFVTPLSLAQGGWMTGCIGI